MGKIGLQCNGQPRLEALEGRSRSTRSLALQAETTAVAALAAAAAAGNFAEFFGLTAGTGNPGPTDYAATIAARTVAGSGRVPFPQNGPTSGGVGVITRVDGSSFTLPAIGFYRVTATIHTTEPGQLELELNGAELPYTVAPNQNPTAGGHVHVISAIVQTTVVNSVLAVINPPGNSPALTITPADGASTHANPQTLVIQRLA